LWPEVESEYRENIKYGEGREVRIIAQKI